MSILTSTRIDIGAEMTAFRDRIGNAGAVVSFSGHVRADAGEENPVTSLELQAHPKLTVEGIERTLVLTQERWPITAHLVRHRVGEIASSETIVLVATAARHRRDAFEAADYLMDYLKTQAVFWKKERRASGTSWIEPRTEDYSDAARWTSAEHVP